MWEIIIRQYIKNKAPTTLQKVQFTIHELFIITRGISVTYTIIHQ